MNDRAFLDTNVLIYLYSTEEEKRKKALILLEKVENPLISTQVINEFTNTLYKKFKCKSNEILSAIEELTKAFVVVSFSLETQKRAIRLKERFGFQYYDSLIIATALENDCRFLYSEDMQNGQIIDTLTVVNPFR
ncbi:PIN domain-containing protein [Nitratifractor sp.]